MIVNLEVRPVRAAWIRRSIVAALAMAGTAAALGAQNAPVTIRASTLIDGRGNSRTNVDIVVAQGKILSVTPTGDAVPAGPYIDLRGRTVMPGLIDAHAHITWYFNRNGRFHTTGDGDTPVQSMLAAAANAYATLTAGFTTIQSPGGREDADLRDWIATQGLPGPRILTSLQPLQSGSPDTLRARVNQRKQQGADFIKIFASASIREGGAQTMSDEQLAAVCGEARKLGLRTLVHAHSAESMKAATLAGCTQIEHGIFATQEVLDLMAAKGTYFDPQCSLVFRNYLDNRVKYNGIGNYNAEGFASMEKALPLAVATVQKANGTPKLKVLYGTDAVAGAHGRNAEDFLCRVQQAHEAAMRVITSATSLNAEAMGLGTSIGSITAGYEADIIAVDGNPLTDITAIRRVSFVMKGGRVVRNDAVAIAPAKR